MRVYGGESLHNCLHKSDSMIGVGVIRRYMKLMSLFVPCLLERNEQLIVFAC
jgi:hypothetical protein